VLRTLWWRADRAGDVDDSQGTGTGPVLAGRYRLLETIGRGGMGRVWRAEDERLHRTVAVKELTVEHYATEAEREVLHRRTQKEARAAARIDHPHVVTVFDVLEHGGKPWIVMQFVAGRSLAEVLKQAGPLTPREAARTGLHVLEALRAAHAAGVLHRDVKPANVMLSREGEALLTDFGIAAVEGDTSVTRTGEIIGSVEYLAPERAKGAAPGPASDLWSLGATLYTAVQGRSPYARGSAVATLHAVVTEDARYPDAAGPLAPLIMALLAKDPDARPQAADCASALRDIAEGRVPRADPGTQEVPGSGSVAPLPHDVPPAREIPGAGVHPGFPSGGFGAGPHGRSPYDGAFPQGPQAPRQPQPRRPAPGRRRGARWRSAAVAIVAAVVVGGGIGYAVTQHVGGGGSGTPGGGSGSSGGMA
jgi:eukaryotic-like serine/threonine-protein kinase